MKIRDKKFGNGLMYQTRNALRGNATGRAQTPVFSRRGLATGRAIPDASRIGYAETVKYMAAQRSIVIQVMQAIKHERRKKK
jgi:hypothetical protein